MNFMKIFILLFFYTKFALSSEIVNFYNKMKQEYNDTEETDFNNKINFMNESLNIGCADYSKGEKNETINFNIMLSREELNNEIVYLQQRKKFHLACWQAAIILKALTIQDGIRQSFNDNCRLFYGLNNTINAAILGMAYISPPLNVIKILIEKGIQIHQGSYVLLTSKSNKTYGGLCCKMENLTIEEWQNQFATIWVDIINYRKDSKFLRQEPKHSDINIEEIDKTLVDYGGIKYLAENSTWQIRQIELRLSDSGKIITSLIDI